jgi:ABC-type sulfate transport system substrate-binding protein
MRRTLLLTVVVAGVAASLAAASPKDVRLALVAYSTPREAYNQLIPAFQKTQAGDGVSFSQSYAASGDQTRAVKAGLDADIVALSLAPDVDELVAAKLVDATWKRQSYGGMVTHSLVGFVVRDGNPKKIRGWNDLIRKDVDVVTPNPFTSGGAANLRRERLPAREQGRRPRVHEAVPGAARPVHDRRPRRLGDGAETVLRPAQRDHGPDREAGRWSYGLAGR